MTCQEVGHTFGLDHPSEDPDVNTGSCMDYYKVPNLSPNQHDYDQLAWIYSHLDSTTTLAAAAGSSGAGCGRSRRRFSVEDLGNGRKRLVWVFWKDQNVSHGPPREG